MNSLPLLVFWEHFVRLRVWELVIGEEVEEAPRPHQARIRCVAVAQEPSADAHDEEGDPEDGVLRRDGEGQPAWSYVPVSELPDAPILYPRVEQEESNRHQELHPVADSNQDEELHVVEALNVLQQEGEGQVEPNQGANRPGGPVDVLEAYRQPPLLLVAFRGIMLSSGFVVPRKGLVPLTAVWPGR